MIKAAPSLSVGRGEILLDPAYFTSAAYVERLKDDIEELSNAFASDYTALVDKTKPFTLFKEIWQKQGWDWLQLRFSEDRARERFLDVTLRLFLERTCDGNVSTQNRAIGLFGMYTFFYTQPRGDIAPKLWTVEHIAVTLDDYPRLLDLPAVLDQSELGGMATAAWHLLTRLVDEKVFYLVPTGAMNPVKLPRETFVETEGKRRGRPSRTDKALRARGAAGELETLIQDTRDHGAAETTRTEYVTQKKTLVESLDAEGRAALEAAKMQTVGHFQTMTSEMGQQAWTTLDPVGLLDRV